MAVLRMDHVGVVVDDLPAAIEFFVALGLELTGEAAVGGPDVDRVIGLQGAQSDIAFVRTPDGHSQIELTRFNSPPATEAARREPSNAPGIRHLTFAVDDIEDTLARLEALGGELLGELVNYGGYRLCYLRGPAQIIIELGEKLG
jgi:catechol 2,3-dioxygenase-like lactoylglutathione lyase family enzyme